MAQEPTQQWSGLAVPRLGTSKGSTSLCSARVCTRLAVCKQPGQLKGLAPALPAPGCVPLLALLPLPLSVAQQPRSSLLSVLVPCQALTRESSQVSEMSPRHSQGVGTCVLTSLGIFQGDVSRGLCSSLRFPGTLCWCAGPGGNNHAHIAPGTVTQVL